MSNKLVLVLNSGSSSLKFALIDAETGATSLTGLGECFGLADARISWKCHGEKQERQLLGLTDHHQKAIDVIVSLVGEMQAEEQLVAVGHRVVHGGERFAKSVRIDQDVIDAITEIQELAPLHNPANLMGIHAAMAAFPALPQVAVFDTAFHQTMPEKAFTAAIDRELYKKYGIRRYGFHGISHYYVSREAARLLDKPVATSCFISVHLGNGASVCAVNRGQSVDTSMGFTPLAGLMMGTRCGDLDPGVIEFLMRKGWSHDAIFDTLNKKSGFLGVSGITSDARGILEAMAQGHEGAKLAFEVFTYRVAKYIASYFVALDQLDAVIFTGGIGENSLPIRREILNNLKLFGFIEDEAANQAARFGAVGQIAKSALFDAVVLVVPTNEEFVIASQSVQLISQS